MPLSKASTFDSLRNSAYRFYFLGDMGQWSAQNMQMLTRSLLIYRLTGSAALLGLMALAMALPMLAFSLLGGATADRLQKKTGTSGQPGCSGSQCFRRSGDSHYRLPESRESWSMVDSDS